jgi:hypothetical protein
MNNQVGHCESKSEEKFKKCLIERAARVNPYINFFTEIPENPKKVDFFKSIKRNLAIDFRPHIYMVNQVHQDKSNSGVKLKNFSLLDALRVNPLNNISIKIPEKSRKVNSFKSTKRKLSFVLEALAYIENQLNHAESESKIKFEKSSLASSVRA